jgi:hypothetical protein
MTAAELLADLRARGIEVTLAGRSLACRPRDRLTPEDREQLRQLKPVLVSYLAQRRFAWELFELAESLGFPWLRVRPGIAIAGDRAGWATFLTEPPEPDDLLRAYTAVCDGEGRGR